MTSFLTITQIINAGYYKSRGRIMVLLQQGHLRGHRQYGLWLVEEKSITEYKKQAYQNRKDIMAIASNKRLEKYNRTKERGDIRPWVPPPEAPVEKTP